MTFIDRLNNYQICLKSYLVEVNTKNKFQESKKAMKKL